MANQNQEHLELRSEKVRHIIGNIPSSLVWISGIVIVLSTIVLAFFLCLFGKMLFTHLFRNTNFNNLWELVNIKS